jgi:hypothetical protein
LRLEFNISLSNVPDPELKGLIQNSVSEAQQAGLETERDIALYTYACAALGAEFPDRTPALFEALVDDEIAYDQRCSLLAQHLEGVERG